MDRTSCFCVLALAMLVATATASQVRSPRRGLRAMSNDPECKLDQALSCGGCTTQVQCFMAGNYWLFSGTVECTGKTPFCDKETGRCTEDSTKAADCPEPSPVKDFECPGAGYWPNLASCTKYYICSGTGSSLSAYAMDCSAFANTVYDQKTARCVPKTATNCFTLTCPSAGSLVPYTPDPSIYAACRDKTTARAAVLRCAKGQTLNATTKECKPACTQAGRTGVDGDNKAYTECVDLGSNKLSEPTPGRCPGTTVFVEKDGRCAEP